VRSKERQPQATFTQENYQSYCDILAGNDDRIKQIISTIGYPPFWKRQKGFEGLVRIILEQQVSLASAFAVYQKLKRITSIVPENILKLSDKDFKACGFSRQKTRYVRILAQEIVKNRLDLPSLNTLPDETVREKLKTVTGIGDWSADIYLLFGLNRLDIFPVGDLALVKSMNHKGFIKKTDSKEAIIKTASAFKPFRSVFTMLMWHAYIVKNNIKVN